MALVLANGGNKGPGEGLVMSLFQAMRRYAEAMAYRMPARIETRVGDTPLSLLVSESPETAGAVEKMSVGQLWRSQPHLRTVVDYIASNVAQLGVHVFAMAGDGNRDRVRDGVVAQLLSRPNRDSTLSEFLRSLVTQMALYDDAFVWVFDAGQGVEMRVIPNPWVTVEADAFGTAEKFTFMAGNGKRVEVGPGEVLRFPGWSPDEPGLCSSPVEALRLILAEQAQAAKFRQQIWRKSGRFMGFITRPKDAPMWDDASRQRFYKMLRAFTSNSGERAGENPLLEDGMDYRQVGFSAKDEQWAESAKISLETVCQVYHVPPVMVGITDDANYSNVTAYQRQLYTNTLGSWLVQIEQRFNAFLLPMLGAPEGQFVEFNIEGKLRGDFAEQYRILQTAVGAPFLTRNEARKVLNYAPVEGGSELVTPLNVLVGGQASPTDGGMGRPVEQGDTPDSAKAREVVDRTVERMRRVAEAKHGVDGWWNDARWRRELADDLVRAGFEKAWAAGVAAIVTDAARDHFVSGKQLELEGAV